jgi:hypothetical protein
MKRAVLVSLFVLLSFSSVPFAAEPAAPTGQGAAVGLKLPSKLAGKTEGVRGATVNVSWSMTVDEVTADGVVRGKMTYPGTTCGAKDAEFTGKYDGKTLTIPMPFSGTAFCRGFVFQLTRKDGANHFEGIYEGHNTGGRPMTLKITLDGQ